MSGAVTATAPKPAAALSGTQANFEGGAMRVGSVAVLGNSITIPAHQPGDQIQIFGYRTGWSLPAPKPPDGWTIMDRGGTGLNSSTVVYKIAASDHEVSGTWQWCDAMIVNVYRCNGRWKPPRCAVDGNVWSASRMEFPDVDADGDTVWYARYAAHRTATNMQAITPAGWTATAGLNTRVRSMDTNGPVIGPASAVGQNTQDVNESASWRTATVSIAAVLPPPEGSPARLVWDKIPGAATVFTLSGLCYNLYNDMPTKFRGIFAQAPYVMKQIKYPASLKSTSIAEGVKMLDTALKSTAGPIIVLGQSQGAQVCAHWMTEHADDAVAVALADRLVFVLTGNPLRATGGGAIGVTEVGGTIGEPTPLDTPWSIVDVARRWDGWADPPIDTKNQVAVANAEAGKKVLHTAYDQVDLYDQTHTVWQDGNTTFVLTAEPSPPLLTRVPLPADNPDLAADIVDATRWNVELAYDNRPPNDPVTPEPDAAVRDWFWRIVLDKTGIAPP